MFIRSYKFHFRNISNKNAGLPNYKIAQTSVRLVERINGIPRSAPLSAPSYRMFLPRQVSDLNGRQNKFSGDRAFPFVGRGGEAQRRTLVVLLGL